MAKELTEFNTLLIDSLIDSLTIIRSFTYLHTGGGVVSVSPPQLISLDNKITILKKIRDLFIEDYQTALKELPKILDELNQ